MPKQYRTYKQLLRLYPKQYRAKYGAQMMQTFDDMLADHPTPSGRVRIWLRTLFDLPISAGRQQLIVMEDSFMHDIPPYVKRSGLIGGVLIAPFFAVVLSGLIQKPSLSNSTPWIVAFTICLLVLPAIAFALNAVAYLAWATDKRRSTRRGIVKSLCDIRHNWPMLIAGGLGLAIFLFVPFHDSVHCVTGNPVREVHNPSQTWQCIWRG